VAETVAKKRDKHMRQLSCPTGSADGVSAACLSRLVRVRLSHSSFVLHLRGLN